MSWNKIIYCQHKITNFKTTLYDQALISQSIYTLLSLLLMQCFDLSEKRMTLCKTFQPPIYRTRNVNEHLWSLKKKKNIENCQLADPKEILNDKAVVKKIRLSKNSTEQD